MNINSLEVKVRELAEQYPDSVYKKPGDKCLYKQGNNGTSFPGCIIGLAIKDLDPNTYANLDGIIHGSIQWVLRRAYGMDGGTDWLEVVQDKQDYERPWSECISIADKRKEK